jgi:hypothetical protein
MTAMRRASVLATVAMASLFAGGAVRVVQGQCGPFTDVTPAFCPYVLEMFYLGITAGTSPTTYSPDNPVTRGQAAVFVSKAVNQSLARSSRRAALGQWWTTASDATAGHTLVGVEPHGVAADGQDVWVASGANGGTVARVRASDGRLLETWTNAQAAYAVLVAMGKVFVLGSTNPQGKLYMIDPTLPAGDVVIVAEDLGNFVTSLAFDGSRIWVGNSGGGLGPGSVSIVTPGKSLPWSVATVTEGITAAWGLVFDGENVWASGAGELLKLDSNGAVLQTVEVAQFAALYPAFDGENIYVPIGTEGVSVVRASSGQLLTTLTTNGLEGGANTAAFDGERLLFTSADNVSLWRAADLSPLGSYPVQANFACSDGINFWISGDGTIGNGYLTRF